MEQPGIHTVGIVGPGRAGTGLGRWLQRTGHEVRAVVAHSGGSAARAREFFPDAEVAASPAVVRDCDLVLLTIPDRALPSMATGLAEAGGLRDGQLVVHASGALGASVLDEVRRHGARPAALHPVMTFTGQPSDVEQMAGISYAVSADPATLSVVALLVERLDGRLEEVPDRLRPLYHAALAHGSNHLVTLVNDACALLRAGGVVDPARLAEPLLLAALRNALTTGDDALTGPVSRGDLSTVAGHLAALDTQPETLQESYRVMARRTARRARDAGRLSADVAGRTDALLADRRP